MTATGRTSPPPLLLPGRMSDAAARCLRLLDAARRFSRVSDSVPAAPDSPLSAQQIVEIQDAVLPDVSPLEVAVSRRLRSVDAAASSKALPSDVASGIIEEFGRVVQFLFLSNHPLYADAETAYLSVLHLPPTASVEAWLQQGEKIEHILVAAKK